MSGLVRRNRFIDGTCSAWTAFCRDVFWQVGVLSGRARRGRVTVGFFSARSSLCRDVFVDVGLVSELVR